MKKILELQVLDRPGVLDRIVGLIRRRGWNIDSLTVGDIGGNATQITIQLEGRDVDLETLREYLEEMDAVRGFQALSESSTVLREMLLFCVPAGEPLPETGAVRVLREEGGLRYCELTDAPSRVDAVAERLHAAALPCVRSGPLPLIARREGGTRNG